MATLVPAHAATAARGMVCAADQLAAAAGLAMLEAGGSAADAAVATAAAMAVVGPHLCGIGGDVLALVRTPQGPPRALLGVGRAGSGASAEALRAQGNHHLPYRGDIRAVTVPGAVDGWLALHQRFGRLSLEAVLEPAVGLAEEGFVASPLLCLASVLVTGVAGAGQLGDHGPLAPDTVVRLPGVAQTLRDLSRNGRDGVFRGPFGQALLKLGGAEFTPGDLHRPLADWVEPLVLSVFGHQLWTVPPPSQGYLTLASAWLAEQAGVPKDPEDPDFAHLLMAAAEAAGRDRPAVLSETADGQALLAPERLAEQLRPWGDGTDPRFESSGQMARAVPESDKPSAGHLGDGDTTHLCATDAEGLCISLTQSNALDFGAHLVAGPTGVFLHNRGLGFSLEPGHPNEYAPGRRPAHTLSPAMVTTDGGGPWWAIGTMGGDAQPQILLQLLTRMLHAGEDPATAMAAGRVVLEAPGSPPFQLWEAPARSLALEGQAPEPWLGALRHRGHRVRALASFEPVGVGHSQIISGGADPHGVLVGASDPRSATGAALGR